MRRRFQGRLLAAALPVVLSAGCASVSPGRGHDRVADLVHARTGARTRWEKGPPDDARVADWVRKQTEQGLTRTRAIEIALVNNPDLGAMYEELGISQADMVQAGLLRNPSLGADIGFPRTQARSPSCGSLWSRTSSTSSSCRCARRSRATSSKPTPCESRTARFRSSRRPKRRSARRRRAASSSSFAARSSRRPRWRTSCPRSSSPPATSTPSSEPAEQAALEQARLDLAREEIAQLEARERLNRLLGLWGETTTWKLTEALPPIPDQELPLAHLESFAIAQRLDVASSRTQAALLHKATDLARTSRLFGRIEVGVDFHRDPNGPRVLGPNLVLELPIFDQRQALIARLEAQERQQQRRLAGLAIDARSEVRLADARLRAARQTALHYRDNLLPLRSAILDQSQLHYNGMFIGPYQLLAAKQSEIEARRGYIEAVRDYWSARAELTRALGGAMPPSANPNLGPAPKRTER